MLHSTSRITCICAFVVLETLTCENQADVKPSTAMHIAKWHQILEVEVEETKAWHLPLLGHSFPWRGRGSRLAKVFHHVAGKLVDGDPRRELLLPFQDLHGLAGPRTHHSWLPVLVPAHRGDADAHRATHNVRSASFLTAFFFLQFDLSVPSSICGRTQFKPCPSPVVEVSQHPFQDLVLFPRQHPRQIRHLGDS